MTALDMIKYLALYWLMLAAYDSREVVWTWEAIQDKTVAVYEAR